ncbi:MAG: isopentenyl-diphosphate Delta-isomerase [Flavobacteriaceae bacterium]
MNDYVILVDENNNQIGIEEKILAHKKNLLHRAFSIFIFNDSFEILLQKRAPNKYHSGNLWTNTCCSHPLENLSLVESAKKRLIEEMGIKANLNEVFSFIYQAEFGNGLSEYEYDHVLFGISNNQPILNPDEAIDYKWIKISDLKAQIEKNPGNFTVWLQIMINNYFKYFEDYENNSL